MLDEEEKGIDTDLINYHLAGVLIGITAEKDRFVHVIVLRSSIDRPVSYKSLKIAIVIFYYKQ
ncbi:MAG: hypothetical protein ACLRQF_01625 [Thomasclavelia ramosa]